MLILEKYFRFCRLKCAIEFAIYSIIFSLIYSFSSSLKMLKLLLFILSLLIVLKTLNQKITDFQLNIARFLCQWNNLFPTDFTIIIYSQIFALIFESFPWIRENCFPTPWYSAQQIMFRINQNIAWFYPLHNLEILKVVNYPTIVRTNYMKLFNVQYL